MDFAKLDALEKSLKNEKYPEDLTSGYFDTIKARRRTLYNKEADDLCKNIGNRANNLYPQEWKIKTTHLPEQPINVL